MQALLGVVSSAAVAASWGAAAIMVIALRLLWNTAIKNYGSASG